VWINSVILARLRDPEVTELMATVIANLVEGEFMQLKNTAQDATCHGIVDNIIVQERCCVDQLCDLGQPSL
jgi:geranylgeranyl pyrophosphate synthase